MSNDPIAKRQEKIYKYISSKNYSAVNEISKALKITPSTVRRDLKVLENNNRIVTFHGGVSVNTRYEHYELRSLKCADQKKIIGQYAATLVENGDVIYIGGGSTTHELAIELSARNDLQNVLVIASSIITASLFLGNNSFRTMIPGGDLGSLNESMTSATAISFIHDFYFTKAFVGTQAVDIEHGYMNPMYDLHELKKAIVDCSQEVILLCDHTKIGKVDPFVTCGLEQLDLLVTDKANTSKTILERMKREGLKVISV